MSVHAQARPGGGPDYVLLRISERWSRTVRVPDELQAAIVDWSPGDHCLSLQPHPFADWVRTELWAFAKEIEREHNVVLRADATLTWREFV